jgi:hypothetical protein
MREKFELSIGEGKAHITFGGDNICEVDDFTIWMVESLVRKANENEASQKLSEERRVELYRWSPFRYEDGRCRFCDSHKHSEEQHKPSCDYVRLTKKEV